MAKQVLKGAIKDKNVKVLGQYVPNMAARYMGMKKGEKAKKARTGQQ